MNPTARLKAMLFTLLVWAALLSTVSCAPKLTREMLTPSPTVTNTPLPTRTRDPNEKPRNTATPRPAPVQVTPTPYAGPRISTQPLLILLQSLALEEYNVGPAVAYDLNPASFEKNIEFYQKIPTQIFEKHKALWAEPQPPDLERLNAMLMPFGYRLQSDDRQGSVQYEVYRGEELIFDHVTDYGILQINPSGSDFILPITLGGYEVWILQKGHYDLWYAGEPRHLPVFVGNDVVAVSPVENFEENGDTVTGVSILVNGQPKYRLALPYTGANMCPIRGLRAWENHWVLELDGDVVIDGKKLTEKYAYEQVFNWQLINGKPFFLFKDGSRFGLFYGDQEQDVVYNEIVRWDCMDQQGGNGINLSVKSNDQIIAFFARRGIEWSYIEVTQNR